MGCQFLHVEAYARESGKGKEGGHSIRSIIAEAAREAGAHPHVDVPAAPLLLFGCSLDEVEVLATAWGDESKDARGHALRRDGLCLLAGVVSAPDDLDGAGWESLKSDTIEWLSRDGRLVSVIEHADEDHRHLHFYKIPAPGARFETIHPGRAASEAARKTGAKKGEQNQAYKKAMRDLQSDFFNEVAMFSGLTRLGPGKRRLKRSEWQAEQSAARAVAKATSTAESMHLAATVATTDATALLAAADKAEAVAAASHKAAVVASAVALADADRADAAKQSLALVVGSVRADRQTLEAFARRGGRLGAFFGKAFAAIGDVFTSRAAREKATAAKLHRAELAKERAEAKATEERSRADFAKSESAKKDYTIDGLTQRNAKKDRAIDALNVKLEALGEQPKPPQGVQSPTATRRLGR